MRVLTLVALLLLVAASASVAAPGPGDTAISLAPVDIRGRALVVPAPGHVLLLSFASRSTGEAAGQLARAMRVAHPELVILSFIDLSSFPGFMRGFARRQIEKRQESALKATRAAFAEAGKPAPADLDARIHIIPDWDGKSCQTYGAIDTETQPRFVTIGADGRIGAVFAETPSLPELEAALAKALGTTPPR